MIDLTAAPLPVPRDGAEGSFALLKAGIPLTLLLDLAVDDPRSEELYERERVP